LSILLQLFNPFIACYARALLVPAVLWFCETPLATPRHATPRHVPGPDRCHVAELISSPRVRFHRVPPNQTTDRPPSSFCLFVTFLLSLLLSPIIQHGRREEEAACFQLVSIAPARLRQGVTLSRSITWLTRAASSSSGRQGRTGRSRRMTRSLSR
jgi:hypothetical protein